MTTTASLLDRSVLPRGSSKLDRSRADWRLRLRFSFAVAGVNPISRPNNDSRKKLFLSLSLSLGCAVMVLVSQDEDHTTHSRLTDRKLHFKLFLRSLAHYFLPNSGVASSPPLWLMLHFSEIHTERKWTVDSTGDGWSTDWTTL